MSTYAIGDIQGCYKSLRCLLDIIQFDQKNDTLWFAGDLVNRGPDSLATLRFIKGLGDSARVVLGNHDLHLLAVAYSKTKPKRKDTIQEILDAPDKDELMDWLRHCPLIYNQDIQAENQTVNYTMVHAGIPPQWTVQQALGFGQEVASALRGSDHLSFFEVMYGNEPDSWSEDLRGNDRLRLITNYLTRMRFCDPQGRIELDTKNKPENAPAGFNPWFQLENSLSPNEHIIFGHWAALEGLTEVSHATSVDTGCVWGNKLTALRLEDRQSFACLCNN